jgi:hypothetical protein
MDKQIKNAGFVLMICTETYYKRVMGEEQPGVGLGVRWEGHLIYQYLYQNGMINTKFIPILFHDSNDNHIPAPLRGFSYYQIDTTDGYDNLYRRLTNQFPQIPNLGKLKQLPPLERRTDFFASPFMAPNLPERFVPRPQLYESLLHLLLNADQQSPIAITTALHGAGGYGKTTLAAALCHDAKIRHRFNDGILWVTLGVKPTLLESLSTIYFALTGERPGFKDINQATENLTLALANRHCLMVIDDVWEYADLAPFLHGGSNCIRLFTTRNFALACEGTRATEVDQMTPDESMELLLGQSNIQAVERQSFYDLADRLCQWPLLLELAGKVLHYRLKCGEKLTDAMQYLNQAYDDKGINAFNYKNPVERNQAVSKTIGVSLDLLTAAELEHYLKLAIFPEDMDVPFTTLSQLWDVTVAETEELLQTFNNLALLRLDLGNKTIRLHDELRLYLISQTKDLIAIHQELLTAWDDLDRLPDEYAWRHLAYHLIHSKQPERLKQLLGNPLWLQRKLANTGINGLVADFDYFQADQDLSYIQRALRLSAHILAKDSSQFVSQMYGRLMGSQRKVIQEMLKQIKTETKNSLWLRSIRPCLISPDSPLIRTLSGHSDKVNGVAVTPDGRRAVSASWDNTLKVWDLESGRELCILTGHSNNVNGVAVTPDSRRAVSASNDTTLKVWDLESGRELCTLTGIRI